MGEAEIQSLNSLISRGREVVLLLLLRHRVPDLASLSVDADVKQLCANEDEDVVHAYSYQYTIAAAVQWLIIGAVDL